MAAAAAALRRDGRGQLGAYGPRKNDFTFPIALAHAETCS